jgi:hypothetical protein
MSLEDASAEPRPPAPVDLTLRWPLQADCDAFYGDPRNGDTYNAQWAADNLTNVPCPWPLHQDTESHPFIVINKKCAESLAAVLAEVWRQCGQDYSKIQALRYDRFSGSFNFRPMRGGTHLSMHAYGCAIDWDAEDNPQHSVTPRFTKDDALIAAFKDEGWTWGGEWSPASIDAMHVQAARVR